MFFLFLFFYSVWSYMTQIGFQKLNDELDYCKPYVLLKYFFNNQIAMNAKVKHFHT